MMLAMDMDVSLGSSASFSSLFLIMSIAGTMGTKVNTTLILYEVILLHKVLGVSDVKGISYQGSKNPCKFLCHPICACTPDGHYDS